MQGSTFQSFFTTQDLHQCTKHLSSTPNKSEKELKPETSGLQFKCYITKEKYDCLAGLELNRRIIYAFARNKDLDCEISILSFQKQDGHKRQLILKNIKGSITTMNFMLYRQAREPNSEQINSEKNYFKLFLGFKDGFLKVINLTNGAIDGVRLDVKPIVSIIEGDYHRFHKQSVCIILDQDHHVYFIDVKRLSVAYILRPNLVSCDKALSIEINQQYSYLMQTSQGGYIIFWKISQILNKFKKISQFGNKKDRAREYNVLPIRVNHSIAIEGITACFFYGQIIALITKSGILKLCVINVKMEQEFVILSEYKIEHPQAISSACMYPHQDCIFISKSRGISDSYVQKLVINEDLNISQRILIKIKDIDAIRQFFIPANASILMCRGENSYGIGYNEAFFSGEHHSRSSIATSMEIQNY